MKAGASLARQLWTAMAALSVMTIIISTAAFYIIYALLERWRIVAPLPPGMDAFTGLDVSITLGVLFGLIGRAGAHLLVRLQALLISLLIAAHG